MTPGVVVSHVSCLSAASSAVLHLDTEVVPNDTTLYQCYATVPDDFTTVPDSDRSVQ